MLGLFEDLEAKVGSPPVRRFLSRALGPSRQTLGTELVSLRRSVPRYPLCFSARPSLFSLLTYLVRTFPVGRRFAFNMFWFFSPERAFGKGQVCCGLFEPHLCVPRQLRAAPGGCRSACAGRRRRNGGRKARGGRPRSAGEARGSGFEPGEAAREREATGVLRLKGVTIATK